MNKPAVDIRGDLVHEVVKRDLTEAEVSEAVQRSTGGGSTVSIADSFSADQRRLRVGLPGLGLLKWKNPLSNAQIAHAIHLFQQGSVVGTIGRDLGVAANTVRNKAAGERRADSTSTSTWPLEAAVMPLAAGRWPLADRTSNPHVTVARTRRAP